MPLRTRRTSPLELHHGGALLLGLLVSSCYGDEPPMDTSTDPFMVEQCGNGTVEEWEECDDGPANSDDGPCSSECT